MSLSQWVLIVVTGGLVASLLFTVLTVVQYFLGSGQAIRDEQGRIREKTQWNTPAVLMLLAALTLFIGVPVVANSVVSQMLEAESSPRFWLYLATAYGIGFLVNLYDLVIIDYVLVVRWRPAFLHLPNTAYFTTMRPHVTGWLRGLGIIFVLSTIAALISLVLYR